MVYEEYENHGVKKRHEILDFIIQFMSENGYSPSVREIADAVSFKSISSINYHLQILKQERKIKMKTGQPRTISVVGYTYRKVE